MIRRPLLVLLIVAAGLSVAHSVSTPAFWPVDETAHVAYADHLARMGNLPTIGTPIDPTMPYPGLRDRQLWELREGKDDRRDIWTANHAPGPSAVQAVALRLGLAAGSPGLALQLARLVSTGFFLLAVWLTHRLAVELMPDRPRTALAAALTMAVTPTATHLAGVAMTDTAAMAATTACLLVGARLLLRGPSRRDATTVALVAGGSALTRASVLPAVALLLATAAWSAARGAGPGHRVRHAARPLVPAALACLPAAAFWLRNVALLGDPSGSGALLAKFGRDPNGPVLALVHDSGVWWRMWSRMWSDLTTGHWVGWPQQGLGEALWVLALIGLAAQLVVRANGAWRQRRITAAGRPEPRLVAFWSASLMLTGVQVGAVVAFHSAGGGLHGRYLLPGHALTVIVIAWSVGAIPRVGHRVIVAVPLVAALLGAWLLTTLVTVGDHTWTRGGVELALPRLAGEAAPAVGAVAALTAAVGVAWLLVRLWRMPADPPLVAGPASAPDELHRAAGPSAIRPPSRTPA